MADRVSAFDIDGMLTEQEGRELFMQEKLEGGYAGIVSARPPQSIRNFLSETNLEPCFIESAPIFKGRALRSLKRQTKSEEYVYYGSWSRDRLHAVLSGWEYKTL